MRPTIITFSALAGALGLVFNNRQAAFDPFVIETIRNAEALFIAGGDQSRYVTFWKGTPVEDAIHHVAAKPAPVGGTSAGMAIMSEFVYSAMSAGVLTSSRGEVY
jgi:cyanophycinase-like exopeptidase